MDEVNPVTDFPEEPEYWAVHDRLPAGCSNQQSQSNDAGKKKIQRRFSQGKTQESARAKYSQFIAQPEHSRAYSETDHGDIAHVPARSPRTASPGGQYCPRCQSVRNQPCVSRSRTVASDEVQESETRTENANGYSQDCDPIS